MNWGDLFLILGLWVAVALVAAPIIGWLLRRNRRRWYP